MKVLAPAKINLSLRVLGRRADGFHELATWMCPIALHDSLELETRSEPGIAFTCDDPTLSTGEENLVLRAARAFQSATGWNSGLRLHLAKNIPHGAGLGGGSSDAASTLLALAEMHPEPAIALLPLAAALGSDVPFFLARSAAVCTGRGEIVTPEPAPAFSLLLLRPGFGVPTAWAYSRWAAAQPWPTIPSAPQTLGALTFQNDLERPVFEKFLFLAELKRWLLAQPETEVALLSGSGSAMFAITPDLDAASTLGARATATFGNLWLHPCSTLQPA